MEKFTLQLVSSKNEIEIYETQMKEKLPDLIKAQILELVKTST